MIKIKWAWETVGKVERKIKIINKDIIKVKLRGEHYPKGSKYVSYLIANLILLINCW